MSFALIVIDGVLRKLMGGAPIAEGIRLYRSLASTGQVILLSNSDDPGERDWLELNGLIRHSFVYSVPPSQSRSSQVNDLRREGYGIDLVVVPAPDEAMALISTGLNTLLFIHAQFAQPSWRPDSSIGVQPWNEITQQVADLARMKAADERVRADD